ncbi:MAG: hypothetical protein ACTHKS_17065, partial [Gaiellaceae bacterium]
MAVRPFLRSLALPERDLIDLPDSGKRFPDGAMYRVEIPSTEGPRCLDAVLETAGTLDVRVHRVSQGSGVFMQTDAELDEMAATARAADVGDQNRTESVLCGADAVLEVCDDALLPVRGGGEAGVGARRRGEDPRGVRPREQRDL